MLPQSELRVSQDSVGNKQSQDSGVTAFLGCRSSH